MRRASLATLGRAVFPCAAFPRELLAVASRSLGMLGLFSGLLNLLVAFAEAEPSPSMAVGEEPASVSASPGLEQDSARVQLQLASIQSRVSEREEALTKLAQQRQSLDLELKNLKSEIQRRTLAGKSIESELLTKRREQLDLQERGTRIDSELNEQRARAKQRLRALYMFRPARLFESLVMTSSGAPSRSAEANRAPYLLAKVREFDRATALRMMRLKEEQSAQALALERVIKERDTLKAKIETERAMLQERVQQKELLVARVAQEKQNLEVLLSELKAESLRLEVVVSSLTSDEPKGEPSERASVRLPPAPRPVGERDEDSVRAGSLPQEASAANTSLRGTQEGVDVPFDGPGLRALRKSLTPPARGMVVRRFGKQRHGEFSDFVFQRGVELHVPPEKPIKAVAPGKVVFAGELPGFGKVVIVDHGKRSYSLYGRLKEQLAQRGSVLEKGAPVGLVDVADRRGSNFYFEVRENGAPVNPASLFSNL